MKQVFNTLIILPLFSTFSLACTAPSFRVDFYSEIKINITFFDKCLFLLFSALLNRYIFKRNKQANVWQNDAFQEFVKLHNKCFNLPPKHLLLIKSIQIEAVTTILLLVPTWKTLWRVGKWFSFDKVDLMTCRK